MPKRALLSVTNKTGLDELAYFLKQNNWEIVASGKTAQFLKEKGIETLAVSEVTGFPEILDGRVKTLHPAIHAAILAKREEGHLQELKKLGISPIDLVVVNLYPFEEAIKRPGCSLEEAIENIDIGGPALIRAAAKNFSAVTVVTDPASYEKIIEELNEKGEISLELRQKLALEAFSHTAFYDTLISSYLKTTFGDEAFPLELTVAARKIDDLRYGENPHQKAAFYENPLRSKEGVIGSKKLQGKELSYNNLLDVDAAINILAEFSEPAVVIIKHTNPCGVAIGEEQKVTYQKAFNADSISAFGGIVGFNRMVEKETAEEMAKTFLEVVIAPSYSKEALEILSTKKNLRALKLEKMDDNKHILRQISGGFLLEEGDFLPVQEEKLEVVTKRKPTAEEMEDLLFSFRVVKHVISNAIVVAKNGVTLGIGAGQMNRVGAAKIALDAAGERAKGAVLASDAFFPFSDTVELAAQNGITAIIEPGGSIRDEDSIKACDKYGIAMVFTKMRHFRH